MNEYADAMRRCLVDLDVPGLLRLWPHVFPHLPPPRDDKQALATLHFSRTQTNNIRTRERAYSHRWLEDHGLPSGLPDYLKPIAERLYPKIVEGVGISYNVRSPILKPIAPIVREAMSNAVLECYADDRKDKIRERVFEAKDKAIRQLLGIVRK